jgi:aspartyl/asparaginyl beta-hydroxylase (cupin superfamily)
MAHDHPPRTLARHIIETPLEAMNAYLRLYAGRKRPPFYDVATNFPHLLEFDRNWGAIREEVDRVLGMSTDLPRYHEVDLRQNGLTASDAPGRSWKVFPLYLMGVKPAETRAMCPRTVELLDRVPDLFQAMFSVLEPGKSIPAHKGPYMGYLRYHLGIRVPKENPPSIRVGDQWYTWEEGKSIVLDDSLDHEVVNHSKEVRVVLIVDVLRPLAQPAHAVNRAVVRTVVRRVYAKRVASKLGAIPFDTGLV